MELGELAAALVPELERAARQLAGDAQRAAFRLLAETYQAAATAVLAKPGETAAAWVAVERSVAAAERAELPLLAAAGDFRLLHVFLSSGHLDQAERVASVATADAGKLLTEHRARFLIDVARAPLCGVLTLNR